MKNDLIIKFTNLRNDEHFQLFVEFGDIVTESDPVQLKIEPQFKAWTEQFAIEETSLTKNSRSAYTAEIRAADARRDTVFRGMADTCKIATTHFREDVRMAAKPLQIIFETYGNLAKKPLNEKASAMFNLLQDLKKHGDAAKTAGLEEWMKELHASNGECQKLMKDRWDEAAAQTAVSMKQARAGVEAAYSVIMERILALKVIEGGDIYEHFLRRLGVVINTYNNTLAQRQGRSLKDDRADDETSAPESAGTDEYLQ